MCRSNQLQPRTANRPTPRKSARSLPPDLASRQPDHHCSVACLPPPRVLPPKCVPQRQEILACLVGVGAATWCWGAAGEAMLVPLLPSPQRRPPRARPNAARVSLSKGRQQGSRAGRRPPAVGQSTRRRGGVRDPRGPHAAPRRAALGAAQAPQPLRRNEQSELSTPKCGSLRPVRSIPARVRAVIRANSGCTKS